MVSLPYDYARCPGAGSDSDGWREGCEQCLRRTSPGGEYQTMMEPPPIIVFECEFLIEAAQPPQPGKEG